jgi:hypothetical protein
LFNKNEEVIAKREKKKKIKEENEGKVGTEEVAEFDENDYRETIKLNELMRDLKLEENNEEVDEKNLVNMLDDLAKFDLKKS